MPKTGIVKRVGSIKRIAMKKIHVHTALFTILLALIAIASAAQDLPEKAGGWSRGVAGPQKLIDLVIEGEPGILKSNDEVRVSAFLKAKNEKIIQYLSSRYPQYGPPVVDAADPATVWFGLICAMYEANNFKPLSELKLQSILTSQIPAWLSCSLSVLGASYGVTQLVNSLGTFSYSSVWTVVKFVVKKYAVGWLGTAVAIYQIANECF